MSESNQLPLYELESRLLYSMVVAGKSAVFADNAIRQFYSAAKHYGVTTGSPFERVGELDRKGLLGDALRAAKTGNYGKLQQGFFEAANCGLDLRTCKPEDLEAIHGVGKKTSRFFIIWTRPDAVFAAVDTHILKWLRYLGVDAPKHTPSNPKLYAELEGEIIKQAHLRKMTPRELDSMIWDWCQAGNHRDGEWPEKLRKAS